MEDQIPWKTSTRYLVVILDSRLKWNLHIEHIITKALAGINIICSLCGTKWGSDPKSLLFIYKAKIRSHLDYCSHLFTFQSKVLASKLDRIQHKALRIILGLVKSTPTNVLLVESNELPLTHRRILLASKLLLRFFSTNDHLLFSKIRFLNQLCQENQFWFNRSPPAIIKAYRKISLYFDTTHFNDTLPIFKYYYDSIWTVSIKFFEFNSLFTESKLIYTDFIDYINTQWPNHSYIYTDGSFSIDSPGTGIAVFCPSQHFNHFNRLYNTFSIFSAELCAL